MREAVAHRLSTGGGSLAGNKFRRRRVDVRILAFSALEIEGVALADGRMCNCPHRPGAGERSLTEDCFMEFEEAAVAHDRTPIATDDLS